jgi:hypothetical protein
VGGLPEIGAIRDLGVFPEKITGGRAANRAPFKF